MNFTRVFEQLKNTNSARRAQRSIQTTAAPLCVPQALLPELPGLPPLPEGPRREVRAVPILQAGVPLALPQRVVREVGRPTGAGHISRQDLSFVEA